MFSYVVGITLRCQFLYIFTVFRFVYCKMVTCHFKYFLSIKANISPNIYGFVVMVFSFTGILNWATVLPTTQHRLCSSVGSGDSTWGVALCIERCHWGKSLNTLKYMQGMAFCTITCEHGSQHIREKHKNALPGGRNV